MERNGLIYLDHAATTAAHPKVVEAMLPFFSDCFYNASSMYGPAQECRQAMENARTIVADALGCKPSEVIFTSGGTESDNAAVRGAAWRCASTATTSSPRASSTTPCSMPATRWRSSASR